MIRLEKTGLKHIQNLVSEIHIYTNASIYSAMTERSIIISKILHEQENTLPSSSMHKNQKQILARRKICHLVIIK